MDLATQLLAARSAIDDLLERGGTRVAVRRPAGDVVGDGTTAAAAMTEVAADMPALLLPAGLEPTGFALFGSAPPVPGSLTLLAPVTADVEQGDVLQITTCLDPRAAGASYLVQSLESSSAGVVRRGVVVQVGGAGSLTAAREA